MSATLLLAIPITFLTIYFIYKLYYTPPKPSSTPSKPFKTSKKDTDNCTKYCCKDWKSLNIYKGTLTNCLEPNYNKSNISVSYPIKNENNIIYLNNLLSKNECELLMNKTNNLSYLKLEGFNGKVRSNKRRRTFDEKMSLIMFDRIKKFVPEFIEIDGCQWKVSRILDYWRYCKYSPGEHFSPHYDGSKVLENYEMSVFTINIYLNDCFIGGGTRFFMECVENAKENDWNESGPVTDILQPIQGGALIFNHCNKGYLHDGEKLGNNLKYIMRADLLYKCQQIDKLKKLEKNGKCKFWSINNAKNEIVKNYVGRTWKCACVSSDVTVTLF